jgi:hypothetical protein
MRAELKAGVFAAVLAVCAACAVPASANVTTLIYSGFVPSGGGAPFSGFVGSLSTPDITFGTDTGFNWHPFGLSEFGADSKGILFAPSAGTYTFSLTSDDGSLAFIDGNLVVDDGNPHGPAFASNSIFLAAGKHTFEVQFFECCGDPSGLDFGHEGTTISSVPEPSTWAMLLLGFGGLGLMYHRGGRKAAIA